MESPESRRSEISCGLMLLGGVVLILLTVIGVWKLGTWVGFFLVYQHFFDLITGYGFNVHISRIAAVLIGAGVWYGAVHVFRKDRGKMPLVIIALVILQSGFLFFATRNRYFSPSDGRPLRYYTINPVTHEVQIFDGPVYDAFQQKAQQMTVEMAKRTEMRRLHRADSNDEIDKRHIKRFFDENSGVPLVWYSVDAKGKAHYFLREGYDPRTGDLLRPVSRDVIAADGELQQPPETQLQPSSQPQLELRQPQPQPSPQPQPQGNEQDDAFGNATLYDTIYGGTRVISGISMPVWSRRAMWIVDMVLSDGVASHKFEWTPPTLLRLDLNGMTTQIFLFSPQTFNARANCPVTVTLNLSTGGNDRRSISYTFPAVQR